VKGDGIPINKSQSAYYFKLSADQGFMQAQVAIANLLRKGGETRMDQSSSAHYYKLAADQGSVEAQLRYANCLLAGDGVKMNKREAEHYLLRASSQGDVKAHMRYGIVLLSGQLGRFDIDHARIEFHLAAPQNQFGSLLPEALSQPLNKLELVEDFGALRSVFTFLLHNGSPAFSIMRTLNVDLDSGAIAESDIVSTWRAMASDTIGYLADFNDIWGKACSISKPLLQPRRFQR
jgi:hypothetical protein